MLRGLLRGLLIASRVSTANARVRGSRAVIVFIHESMMAIVTISL